METMQKQCIDVRYRAVILMLSLQSALPLVNESNELGSTQSLENMDKNGLPPVQFSTTPSVVTGENSVHHIIIDCSNITFIDTVGAKILKQLVEDCDSIYLTVLLARVNGKGSLLLHCTFRA